MREETLVKPKPEASLAEASLAEASLAEASVAEASFLCQRVEICPFLTSSPHRNFLFVG